MMQILTLLASVAFGIVGLAQLASGQVAVGLIILLVGGIVAIRLANEGRRPPDPAPAAAPSSDTKTCPDCAESVLAASRICRFCRHEFAEGQAAPSTREG